MGRKLKIYEGQVLDTTNYGKVLVLECERYDNILIKFLNTGSIRKTESTELLEGSVKDYYAPKLEGVGYPGEGLYNSVNARYAWTKWRSMLSRCYAGKIGVYEDVIVNEQWHNFQNFAAWAVEQKGYGNVGWHLDKDIIVRGSKQYSPDTCAFVPVEINAVVLTAKGCRNHLPIGVYYSNTSRRFIAKINKSGVQQQLGTFDNPLDAFSAYKVAKEAYIKLLAERWRNDINESVYQSLVKWEINIDD